MVNISCLWGDKSFHRLSKNSKLLLLYLITNPKASLIGVVKIDVQIMCFEVGFLLDEVRVCCKELISKGFVVIVPVNSSLYFITPYTFKNLQNKQDMKVLRCFEHLPKDVLCSLSLIGIKKPKVNRQPPSCNDVLLFGLSKCFYIDARGFLNYYLKPDGRMIDKQGGEVLDWMDRAKGWMKTPIVLPNDYPDGFMDFHVIIKDKLYVPDYWRDGLPCSKDYLINKELKIKFENQINAKI